MGLQDCDVNPSTSLSGSTPFTALNQQYIVQNYQNCDMCASAMDVSGCGTSCTSSMSCQYTEKCVEGQIRKSCDYTYYYSVSESGTTVLETLNMTIGGVVLFVVIFFLITICCRRTFYGRRSGFRNDFARGICDCGSMCCRGFCCAPCLVGATGDALEEGKQMTLKDKGWFAGCFSRDCILFVMFDICGLGWLVVANQRKRLRGQYELKGDEAGDCAATCCCSMCSICQNANQAMEVVPGTRERSSEEELPLQTIQRQPDGRLQLKV